MVSCTKDDDDDGTANQAPVKPYEPNPADEATEISTSLSTLQWNCSDPDEDAISYDVYFGTEEMPQMIETIEAELSYTLSALEPNTTYYWKIVANDNNGGVTEGDVWSFATGSGGTSNRVLVWDGSVIDNGGTGTLGVGYNCQIVAGADQTLHTVYTDRDNFTVKYAYKTVGGSWTVSNIATDASTSLAALAIGIDDKLHVIYEVGVPSTKFMYASKEAGSSTWDISDLDVSGYYPASTDTYINLKADANNGLHLISRNTGGDNYLNYFYKPNGGAWTKEILDNRIGCGNDPDIIIKNNTIHVSYGDDGTNGELFYATKPIESGSWEIETVATSTAFYQTAIDVNSAGDVYIIYRDYAGGFKCSKKSGTTWNTNTLEDSYAFFPGMVISQNEYVYAVYSYNGGEGCKLAYKTPDSDWSILMLDEINGYGYIQYTDIINMDNDNMYVVYQAAENGSGRNILKMAHIYWEDEE